jgi:putative membrane protein
MSKAQRANQAKWQLLVILGRVVALMGVPQITWAHAGGSESTNPWSNWPFEPEILAGVSIAAALYLAGCARRYGRTTPVSAWRHASFFAGLAMLLIALQSPLDALADHSFTMHQVQHLLLGALGPMLLLLAAPQTLLVAGMPDAMRRLVLAPLLVNRSVQATFAFLAHPAVATFVLIAAVYFWHLPKYHNLAVIDVPIHYTMHVTMLVSGLFFFWRVLDPRPAPVGAGYGVRVVMASVAMAGSMPLAAYITYKSSVLYPAYDVKGRLWGLDALLDERYGGLIMWIPGGIVFGVLLLIVMRFWGRRDAQLNASGRFLCSEHRQRQVGMEVSCDSVGGFRVCRRDRVSATDPAVIPHLTDRFEL